MHKLRSVQGNEMHKVLWDFEIQTDHLILARQLDIMIVKKKKKKKKKEREREREREREIICRIVDFAVPADHRQKLK